jgi:hypothetical protein
VRDNDPTNTLYVQDIEADSDSASIEVVFGVGAIEKVKMANIGYRGLTRQDLLDDVVQTATRLDSVFVVRDTLPQVLRSSVRIIPVYKYLRGAGYLDDHGELIRKEELDDRLIKIAGDTDRLLPPSGWYRKRASKVLDGIDDWQDLIMNRSVQDVLFYGTMLRPENVNPEDVLLFLRTHQEALMASNALLKTQYNKLVCLYDLLAFRYRSSLSKVSSSSAV